MTVPPQQAEETLVAQIKSVDMSDDLSDEAIEVCMLKSLQSMRSLSGPRRGRVGYVYKILMAYIGRQAMAKHSVEKDIAQYVKKAVCIIFDEKRGPTWHCIVGRNFGSFVTHGIPIPDSQFSCCSYLTFPPQKQNTSSTSTSVTARSFSSKLNKRFSPTHG
ncbi:hypothetical protein DSL72_008730 [Monilinia vaccinii-corymbosi]|uniref:Dynein light chain n=1 Tax=Monilinia vaccinii-corymbosi TaxID=61207 RepID=A0A8A3PS22_9HELO|nr:hypothetical protein DSL72_008730 [Monilinia vaccinii-corymbosi]